MSDRDASVSGREARYRAIFESAVDFAIIATDPAGLVTDWNTGAERTLGWSADDMLGRNIDCVFTPEDRAAGQSCNEMSESLVNGRASDERWHIKKDGTRFWAVGELMPLLDGHGTHLGFVKILRDRTDQRRLLEKQQADNQFLQSVLASSGDCIKVLDLDARLLFMTDSGKRVMEVSDFNAIRGCPWPDFWHGEGNVAAMAAVAAAQAGRTGHFQGPSDTMAGTPKFWDVQVTPIMGSDGQPEKLLSVSRDITIPRQIETALHEAQGLNTLILNSSRDCIVVLDLDGHTQFISPGGVQAMEIADAPSVIGEVWLDRWQGADRDAAQIAVTEARAGRLGRFRGYCPSQKGTPKWWDTVISPLAGADGRLNQLVAFGRDITETWKADLELRRLGGLVEQTNEFIGIATPDGMMAFVNPAGREMLGLASLDTACSRTMADYLMPTDRGMMDDGILPALHRTGSWQGELDFRHFGNGTAIPMLCTIFTLRDASGAVTGYGTVARDLRAARSADARRAALLELSDRLGRMGNPAAMAFSASEIIGRLLGVDAAGYATMDDDGETGSIARHWTAPGVASIAGTHQIRELGSYLKTLQAGEMVIVEDNGGNIRDVAVSPLMHALSVKAFITLRVQKSGRTAAFFFVLSHVARHWGAEELSFVRNVTERAQAAMDRHQAEASLREFAVSLERQVIERTADRNRLWELSSDIMLRYGVDGTIMAVNPAWMEILGWAEAELVGFSLFCLLHPDDRDRTVAGAAILSTGAPLDRFENRYRCKDDSYRWIAWSARAADGVINAVGRDCTAEKHQADALAQAEERLRQSQKMEAVGQLTGGLAHDFNNLLTGISGSLELLQTRVAQGRVQELDRYVNAAQGAAKRAAALTHRLLAFSRQQTLDPKPTDVNRLVAGMEEFVQRTAGPAITLQVVAADGIWAVHADQGQLENALLNLCINARDAMPDGGTLTIETSNVRLDAHDAVQRDVPPGQYVALSVTDSGSGMPAAVIARAFDPFFTTKPLGMGTGLGLSMIYGFARQSGGQVRIESEVGKGTRVCVYLPRHFGQVDTAKPSPDWSTAPRAEQGETVLVLDDEATVRMLVTEVLETLGYNAIEAADGAAGLKVLNSDTRIDLLVTDVGLPGGMNGRQVAEAARVRRPDLKVLFITGYAENAALSHGHLGAGMHVMTKPFGMEALANRIKHLTAR